MAYEQLLSVFFSPNVSKKRVADQMAIPYAIALKCYTWNGFTQGEDENEL